MGRMMPVECKHGHVWDWGDFGCQHDDYDEACRYCNPPECPECAREHMQDSRIEMPR